MEKRFSLAFPSSLLRRRSSSSVSPDATAAVQPDGSSRRSSAISISNGANGVRSLRRRLSAMLFQDASALSPRGELYAQGSAPNGDATNAAASSAANGPRRNSLLAAVANTARATRQLSRKSGTRERTLRKKPTYTVTQVAVAKARARGMAREAKETKRAKEEVHTRTRRFLREPSSRKLTASASGCARQVRFYRKMFELVDASGGGSIQEEEFVRGLAMQISAAEGEGMAKQNERMRFVDALYKGLRVGYLETRDHEVSVGAEIGSIRSRARAIFKHIDKDGCGAIDFSEMVHRRAAARAKTASPRPSSSPGFPHVCPR